MVGVWSHRLCAYLRVPRPAEILNPDQITVARGVLDTVGDRHELPHVWDRLDRGVQPVEVDRAVEAQAGYMGMSSSESPYWDSLSRILPRFLRSSPGLLRA